MTLMDALLDAPLSPSDALPTARADAAAGLSAQAVVFEGDKRLGLRELELIEPHADDIVVDVEWSGVSTGTERLLWSGDMPPFPGMGYPLVPGYEAIGRVARADGRPALIGRRVFVPGSHGFKNAKGLFGASAARVVVPADRATVIDDGLGEGGVLLALAATAYHAMAGADAPDLIVGHGVLGRLLARIAIAVGAQPPVVWEIDPERADGDGYAVIDPECDGRSDYRSIYDVSGDASIIDRLVAHMARGGEIVLAGFYTTPLSFTFPPAFMKEARLRVAAEWAPSDLERVLALLDDGALSFDGLITHRCAARDAPEAYRTAFEDSACLKMVLDWREMHDGRL